ncbi:MAG: rod-binding protein [Myxococcota bacterium]
MSIKGVSPIQQAVAQQRAEESKLVDRAGGKANPGEAFESVMLKKMVQSLRATVQESGLWEGVTGGQMYDHFIEQALSDHLAQSGGIGIAQLFEQEAGSQIDAPSAARRIQAELPTSSPDTASSLETVPSDDQSRSLAEQLPPQYDSWLNSPVAEQTLRATLSGEKLR